MLGSGLEEGDRVNRPDDTGAEGGVGDNIEEWAPEVEKHVIIFAARDVYEGEEVTYDYKFPLEEQKLSCYCGASRCLGSMN